MEEMSKEPPEVASRPADETHAFAIGLVAGQLARDWNVTLFDDAEGHHLDTVRIVSREGLGGTRPYLVTIRAEEEPE